ncbi:hypothetical protein SK128_023627, partial [Halocaridina rubra]
MLNVRSNDMYQSRVALHDVTEKYRDLIDILKNRFKNIVFSGTLPRHCENHFALNRAIGVYI